MRVFYSLTHRHTNKMARQFDLGLSEAGLGYPAATVDPLHIQSFLPRKELVAKSKVRKIYIYI